MEKNELLIKMVLMHEGGYANVKNDNGGETYCGIARRSHSNWVGWKIIDENKPLKYNQRIANSELEQDVIELYEKLYYTPMKISLMKNMMLSAHVFCHGVNAGSSTAIKLLQRAINDTYKTALIVDGKIGNQTLSYVNNDKQIDVLVKNYISKRNEFYQNIVKRNSSQKKFLNGWLSRVKGTTQTINNYYNSLNQSNQQNIMFANSNNILGTSIMQRIFNFVLKMFTKR